MHLWYHKQVVDARAGPGMKSMTKYKSKSKKPKDDDKIDKKKSFTREYSPALSDKSDGMQQDVEMNDVDFLCESGTSTSNRSSRTASPGGSDCDDNASSSSSVNRRHKTAPKRREKLEELSEFVDMEFWKMYV